ncbi:hypothetical protein [Dyadobacter crusticola]|uniref:hypothetical protein n=1 Tax=Dyadobacter crusticola TaxID=292407 RepID=UPI0004E22EBD|nr:hypothetical protein [Dyadobacter crusticola]
MRNLLILILLVTTNAVMAQEPFTRSYINHTEAGGLFGRVRSPAIYNYMQETAANRLNLTVQTFNGIQINRKTAAGITLGIDWYKAAFINPIAAGIRYDVTRKKNVNILAQLDAGYGFAWFHDDPVGYKTKGGVMLNPAVGIRCGKAGNAAFTFTISYKRQEAEVDKPPLWNQTERHESRIYNRLGLRMGISF